MVKVVLHINCHSFGNAPKKFLAQFFRKKIYASQLAPVIFSQAALEFNIIMTHNYISIP
jgi:hypothetical protein